MSRETDMKESIYVLYKFSEFTDEVTNLSKGRYRIIFLFDHKGFLEKKDFKKVCDEHNLSLDTSLMDFSTKEELLSFSLELGQYFQMNNALLLSVNDYNIGIESCHDLEAFQAIFSRYGTTLPCKSSKVSEKGLFSKFF